ncbi:MAG: hypothetical protein H6733_09145 [Alphaproteobacteria bacterium]|nr:hypothetical protein [Alphaproteobacteria bacterium]
MSRSEDHDDAVELPSSTGRDRVRLDVCDRHGIRSLVLAYEASVYDDRSLDPVAHVMRTPRVRLRDGSLEALLGATRRLADMFSIPEPPVDAATCVLSYSPRLSMTLGPPGPDIPPWRALFSFEFLAVRKLSLQGEYAVDATCLDLFAVSLGALISELE